ncbi:MAG: MFS transporter [Gemmatimonadetes bacterium]|nr:MFS transporter [Gemmatimonadota bacterium]
MSSCASCPHPSPRNTKTPLSSRRIHLAVFVAALGYFVDVYDLLLFSIVRVPSLLSLGVAQADVLAVGVRLINMQMTGLLLGGIAWGILADNYGRRSVLFGSILMYSLANIANAGVQTVDQYAWLRFIAGIGLAGELGAGITLVAEIMSREGRGWGTTIVASLGLLGAVVAGLVGDLFPWRTAYVIGGVLGLSLLALRIGVTESGMFEAVKKKAVGKGNMLLLFSTPTRALRYLSVVLVGLPTWFVMGILVTFSPEIGKALGLETAPTAGRAVMFAYIGATLGDLLSGALSQVLRSRKKALLVFITLCGLGIANYFIMGGLGSLTAFYLACGILGATSGYWAVFVTVASEQFGTNLRGTVASTAPNFVRGAVVPLTIVFQALKPELGIPGSAMAVGAATLVIAYLSLAGLEETFGKNLDYVES